MKRSLDEAANRAGLIDAGLVVAMAILDELEKQNPGFERGVRDNMEAYAKRQESRGEDGDLERAKSVRDLIDQIFFG